ncbi:hypothetical protein [Paenibacillus brevis]|nr:hypothetical protein [Paenibacillus brevis]
MDAGLFKIDLGLNQLEAAINPAVDKEIEGHALQSQMEPLFN